MTYSVDGKQYIAIAGGNVGAGNAVGHSGLEMIQPANMIWVFAVE